MLTSRMRKSLKLILRAQDYITLGDIAAKLEVSTRTLLREMNDLEQWVEENEGTLMKKKGRGVKVLGDLEEKERLLDHLANEKSNLIFTPYERSILLKSELLKAEEITKLYSLTTYLQVSETTVGLDLVSVTHWFQRYQLELIKRQGLGITVVGTERNRRKAIVALLEEQMHMDEFLVYMDGGEEFYLNEGTSLGRIRQSLYGLFAMNYLPVVTMIINNVENHMEHSYTDNGYMTLALVFCVVLQRRSHWGMPLISGGIRSDILHGKTFGVLKLCLQEEADSIFRDICDEEIMYLAMHFEGTKLRETKNDNFNSMVDDFGRIQLIKEFIRRIEEELNIYISDNETLLYGLLRHLRSALYRMKMDLDIVNPLLKDIITNYPDLYKAVAKCVDVIEDREEVKVSVDEIAYLAIYIGAIIQEDVSSHKAHFQIVVACMYGIGASQLLLANIKKNFRDIDIVEVVSVVDVKQLKMQFSYADLIISTVPLEMDDTPCVVVNPVLPQQDVDTIRYFMKKSEPKHKKWRKRSKPFLSQRLSILNVYSYAIISLLEAFTYDKNVKVKTIHEVIVYASQLIGSNDDELEDLIKAFELREEIGSTVLSKKGVILLHCRANVTDKAVLKIIQTITPIPIPEWEGSDPVHTVIVMVAPIRRSQAIQNILSEVTRSIISGDFGDQVLYSDRPTVRLALEGILETYYKKLVDEGVDWY